MRKGARGLLRELDPSTVQRYSDYVLSIRPTTTQQVLNRWIFAFCSIHTTWENNVRGYSVLRNSRLESEQTIRTRLEGARIGLHNAKARALFLFGERFWGDPDRYAHAGRGLRDELSGELQGIGLAKCSFAFEMIDPTAETVCLDRHVLRWLTGSTELNGKMKPADYHKLENRWLRACKEFGFNPIAARHACWDKTQGKPNMRYWSHVLEDDPEVVEGFSITPA